MLISLSCLKKLNLKLPVQSRPSFMVMTISLLYSGVSCFMFYPKITHPLHNRTIYIAWMDMKKRCLNPNNESYPIYGGKGVKIYEPWIENYVLFLEWAVKNGWQKGLQLDKDTKGDGMLYSPETCCWVTPIENANKRSTSVYFEHKGQKLTLRQIARLENVNYNILYSRIYMFNMSLEEAISKPVKVGSHKKWFRYNGKNMSMLAISKLEQLPYGIFKALVRRNKYKGLKEIVRKLKNGEIKLTKPRVYKKNI